MDIIAVILEKKYFNELQTCLWSYTLLVIVKDCMIKKLRSWMLQKKRMDIHLWNILFIFLFILQSCIKHWYPKMYADCCGYMSCKHWISPQDHLQVMVDSMPSWIPFEYHSYWQHQIIVSRYLCLQKSPNHFVHWISKFHKKKITSILYTLLLKFIMHLNISIQIKFLMYLTSATNKENA